MAAATIGVPVYRGGPYLAQALASVRAQTCPDYRVLISVDGPDPESEAVCAPFLDDPRFELVVQPERLGWLGNINWLMSQVRTDFWYYHQQDDTVDPTYLEVLLEHARRYPRAAVVYCDMRSFGEREGGFVQEPVTGSTAERMLALLRDHHPAVAFRGLTRREALETGRLRPNEEENFGADTTWMAGVARWGELRRVPQVLYSKRYHAQNVHTKWAAWPVERRKHAWAVHCRDMLEHALKVDASVSERQLLWHAAASRVLSTRVGQSYLPPRMGRGERLELLRQFFGLLDSGAVSAWLEQEWATVERLTLARCCPSDFRVGLSRVLNRLRSPVRK